MRTGFRVLGWILVVAALALLARDLYMLAHAGHWAPIDTGALWWAVHPGSQQGLQPAIEGSLPAWVWDPVVLGILLAPAFATVGGLGIVVLLLAGRRPPRRRSRRFGG